MNKNKKQIVVGMSGGVDSSMALLLLKEQDWDPVGVSLKYAVWQDKDNLLRENVCCSKESFRIAKKVCRKLGVSHYVFDVSKEFKAEVIDYFIKELKKNRTPNPCVICNRYLKFKKLFEWAGKHNIDYVATGHYARTKKNLKTGKYELLRAKDKEKDQTYSLSFLAQKWLGRIIFPLADYTKQEIYNLAKRQGFEFFLKRKQSQDFCFVSGKCMECFLKKEIDVKQGPIKDIKGNVLGTHQGLHFYTIGQRKGINLSNGPYFVLSQDTKNNTLIVTKNEKDLYVKEVFLCCPNFISGEPIKSRIRIKAKTRSHQDLAGAALFPIIRSKLKLVFNKPQKAITPGQFAVFYSRAKCLGAGIIK